MSVKEQLLASFKELPDDVTWAEAEDRLRLLAAIEKAEQELARGEGIPHEAAKKQINEWLQKLSGHPAH